MKKMRFFSLLLAVWGVTIVWAQGPNDTKTYYQSADGFKGKELKTALFRVISAGAKDIGYDNLYQAYKTTDVRDDGSIWDIYSDITHYSTTDHGSGANGEGQGWNREHTIPKSWFERAKPMHNDIFHVYPADIYINTMRSNYPYGEVNNPRKTTKNGFCKLGPCSTPGYTGTVFEPADEYKGDLARTYFYMATRYEDKIGGWTYGESVFGEGTYPGITDWQLKLLLRWAKEDPVSQKEIVRNNAAFVWQKNRNPYIDYPGLEQYVWGDSVNVAFNYAHYGQPNVTPIAPDPGNSEKPIDPENPVDPENPTPNNPSEGQLVFIRVSSLADLQTGQQYILVSEKEHRALGAALNNNVRGYSEVTVVNDNTIHTAVNTEGMPRTLILGGSQGSYTFYDSVDKAYLSINDDKNYLQSVPDDPAANVAAQWDISIADGVMRIANNGYAGRYIKYNASHPRFATYKGENNTFRNVTLYKVAATTSVGSVGSDVREDLPVHVYTMNGMLVRQSVSFKTALQGLPEGLYVIGGKKYVVK